MKTRFTVRNGIPVSCIDRPSSNSSLTFFEIFDFVFVDLFCGELVTI